MASEYIQREVGHIDPAPQIRDGQQIVICALSSASDLTTIRRRVRGLTRDYVRHQWR